MRFEGLATLTDAWVDNRAVLHSESMWAHHDIHLPQGGSELVLRFSALTPWLAGKRPRPRWRARLVEQQNLRWLRTSLLGRVPGWSPPAPIIGPWRPVTVRALTDRHVEVRLHAVLNDALTLGRVSIEATLTGGGPVRSAQLRVDDTEYPLEVRSDGPIGRAVTVIGEVTMTNPHPWWPHTHGVSFLYPLQLLVDGSVAHAGHVGFRTVVIDRGGAPDNDGFGVVVNNVAVFARGACWTPGREGERRRTLERLRDAGANMVRVGGTMLYEPAAFHELSDELGLLVWQDFMFANLDVPIDDPALTAAIEVEARSVIGRLRALPSTAVLCGGNEVGLGVTNYRRYRLSQIDRVLHLRATMYAVVDCFGRRPGAMRWLERLVAARVPTLLMFGERDPGLPYLEWRSRPSLRRLTRRSPHDRRKWALDLVAHPSLDHPTHEPGPRAAVIRQLQSFVAEIR